MTTTRRAVAVTCIALVVFAAVLPLGGVSLDWLAVTPAFTLLPACATVLVAREAPRCEERLVALLANLDSRGPPRPSFVS